MKKALPFQKRNLASLIALTILVFSMFVGISAVPFRTLATAPSMTSPLPEAYEPLFQDFNSADRSEPYINISPNLHSYVETGEIPDALRGVDGALEVYVTSTRTVDFSELGSYMKILNIITLEMGYIIQGLVNDPKEIYRISSLEGIGYVWGNENHKVIHDRPGEGPATDNFLAREIMGVSQVEAEFPGYNGTGITIGIVDTGVDFGVTDLVDAIALDASGHPTSFDPGGSGIAITTFALPSVGNYLLTQGLDFRMFRNDGAMWWSNSTYGLYAQNMYVGGITSMSGFYKVGMSVQIADGLPFGRAFFVYLLTDSAAPFIYDTLYVDFETSWALTAGYNGVSTSVAADWSFSNDAAHMFDTNPILAKDFDGDGNNDYSMGSLSNTFDLTGQITGDLLSGIDTQGRGFAFMYDNWGHGTSCAGTAAGRGITEFDVYGNGTLYTVPGTAPGASIMALKTFTIADDMWTWFWGSGYRPVPAEYPYAYFENWTFVGTDKAHILSNSWGWSSFNEGAGYDMVNSYDVYSLAMDYLTFYTDTLFTVSTGNTGPGYGTVSRPESIFALMVGASTTSHIWQGFYSNMSQGYDTVADFTSVGPTPQGFLGVDLVAVGAYAFDIVPLHAGDGTEFTIFGGTSQASPFAAGVAAIVMQAGMGIPADFTRAVLMNGADDLGYDVYRQGAGRINAYKSIHMAFGNDTDGTDPLPWIWTEESWFSQYWGDRSDPWRGWYMNMFYGGFYGITPFDWTALYHPSWTDPGALVDGAVFPGPIYRGDSYWFNVSATSASGNGVDSLDAYTYDLLYEESATMVSTSTLTTFNITNEFSPTFLTNWATADYAVIHLTYPQSNLDTVYSLSGQANYVFLHDWVNDTNMNGIIDFGMEEIRRISSDTAYGNSHTITLGNPASHFWGDPTVYYHDVGVELFLWRTLDVNVTIRLFERIPWTWVSTSQYGIADPQYPVAWNISIDVPSGAMPGCYEGYLEAINGTGVTHMPISFRVDAQMTDPGPAGAVSWGGSTDMPFDNGATYGNTQYGYRPQVGDWRFYFVDVNFNATHLYPSPPSYIFINVTWTDPDTRLDVLTYYSSYGYYTGGTDFAWMGGRWTGSSTWERQQAILTDVSRPFGSWDYTWFSRGYFGIAVRTADFGASTGGPEDIYITVSYGVENHPNFPPDVWAQPAVWLNASSSTMAMGPILPNSNWTGPQIDVHTNWSALVIPEFPSISIRQTRVELLSEVFHQNFGTIEGPVIGGWNPDLNPREGYDYVDLLAGQSVEVSVEFGTWDGPPGLGTSITHAGDIDVFIWAPGAAHTGGNSLVGFTMSTGANPETGTFVAPLSGTYTIGLDYYSGPVPMAWKTDVYAFQAVGVTADGQSAMIDSSSTGTNARYGVRTSMITGTTLDADSAFSSYTVSNIGFTNFFAPTILSIEPNGGEVLGPGPFQINWTATDPNVATGEEVLQFSVEVSNDTGATWKSVSFGTTLNSIVWDPQNPYYGLPAGDQFLVRVNCTDGMYSTSLTSAAVFTVEGVPPAVYIPYELIVAGAVIAIVIIILIATCLLKRRQTALK